MRFLQLLLSVTLLLASHLERVTDGACQCSLARANQVRLASAKLALRRFHVVTIALVQRTIRLLVRLLLERCPVLPQTELRDLSLVRAVVLAYLGELQRPLLRLSILLPYSLGTIVIQVDSTGRLERFFLVERFDFDLGLPYPFKPGRKALLVVVIGLRARRLGG